MSYELVSVIVPTFGRSVLLGNALNSLKRQTYQAIEIIVVDDNEPSSEHRNSTERLIKKYDDIVYIRHEENRGGCAARNTGINNARGHYLGFLDDDDEWDEKFISKHLEKFNSKTIGAVYCNFFLHSVDENKIDSKKIKFENFKGQVFDKLLEGWSPASTSLFIVKKECFINCGLFDINLASFQDYDMWLRIAKIYEFNYCEEYLVIKNEHTNNQVSLNPVSRQKGFGTLKDKWLNLLEPDNRNIFSKTLLVFQKQIIYSCFIIARSNRSMIESIKKIIEYNKIEGIDVKISFQMLIILIVGYKPIKLLKRIASKKFLRH